MVKSRNMTMLQKFTAIHASLHNHFDLERHLSSRANFKRNRDIALVEWRKLTI
jgi:putative transposase